MLFVKGYEVSLDLVGGRKVDAPARHGMMHDPKGSVWPRCSVLIGPFARSSTVLEGDVYARTYLGDDYELRRGEVELPPKSLESWAEIGQVKRVWYLREGTRAPGRYQHTMRRTKWLFRLGPALLYRHGSFRRLELPAGCVLDERGFVYP